MNNDSEENTDSTNLFLDIVSKGNTAFHNGRDIKGNKTARKWHHEPIPNPSGDVNLNFKIGVPH